MSCTGKKYSFLNVTVENVTCVTQYKAKKNFQTSHFVANGCSVTSYIQLDHIIICAPILIGLSDSYCIIRFVGLTNVTG